MAVITEVRVRFTVEEAGKADLVRCMMINIGVPAEEIVEKIERGMTQVSFYSGSPGRAAGFIKRLRAMKLKGIRVYSAEIKDGDWTTRWKKYFRPFNISRDIRIVPLWTKGARIPAGSHPVYLDTTFAFGSGLHATTQMMAQFMCGKKKHIASFLDIGTGSGILALIASAYGSQDIWALDIDPVAIMTAANNCRINHCRFKYLKAIKFEKFRTKKQFDFVAANLLTEDLIRMRDRLISMVKPGGYLAVSGIYCENYPALRKKFTGAGLAQARVTRKKKWYAVLFKRRRSLSAS